MRLDPYESQHATTQAMPARAKSKVLLSVGRFCARRATEVPTGRSSVVKAVVRWGATNALPKTRQRGAESPHRRHAGAPKSAKQGGAIVKRPRWRALESPKSVVLLYLGAFHTGEALLP